MSHEFFIIAVNLYVLHRLGGANYILTHPPAPLRHTYYEWGCDMNNNNDQAQCSWNAFDKHT